jgi:hypothetical protein
MPFRNSSKSNGFAGAGRATTYQAGKSHRRTEEHGDLNTYNRVFQFYNYHADKDVLLDEMCRGLILSVLRIAGGTVQDYEEPIAWPSPMYVGREDHAHHSAIVFHMKDNRRHSATFGKTLSTFSGRSLGSASHVPDQYDADVFATAGTVIPSTVVALHNGTRMFSLRELAENMGKVFFDWISYTQDFDITETIVPKGIDLLPSRMQLIKTSMSHTPLTFPSPPVVTGQTAVHEVVYDDIEFGDSKVNVSAYTSVKLHNVTPASGNVLLASDPLGSDNITHVPLKGKMYVFSGPTPKVWDKHRDELQHLMKPAFFRRGRYLLPNSKLHSTQTEEFRTPPRGRFIWSNCVDEHKITMSPGGIQEVKLNYSINTSIKDFWYKYRDDDLSSSKLGKCICICLEPSMRRTHVNTPKPVVLVKQQRVLLETGKYSLTETRTIPVEYQPYEYVKDSYGVTTKQPRPVFTLGDIPTPTPTEVNDATAAGGYEFPGAVPSIPWYVDTLGGMPTLSATTANPAGGAAFSNVRLMWDKITTAMIDHSDDTKQLQAFVSRGDPLMFNVQINRTYGASCSLRNTVRLGMDKSGVKRKYDEKMVNNMGDLNADGLFNDADWEIARAAGDVFRDHELDSAGQAGVRTLVLEGDAQNTTISTGGGGSTLSASAIAAAITSAMDTDGNAANGVQLDISQLDGIIANGELSVKMESIDATAKATMQNAMQNALNSAAQINVNNVTSLRDAFGVPMNSNGSVITPGDNAALHIGTAVEYPEGSILVDGVRMSYKVVKDHLMWEVGVVGVLLAAAEVLMATGSFGLSVLNTIIGGSITADQLIAAHQPKDVNIVSVKAGVTVPVSLPVAAGVQVPLKVIVQDVDSGITNTIPVDLADIDAGITNSIPVTGATAATDALDAYRGMILDVDATQFTIKKPDGTTLYVTAVMLDNVSIAPSSTTSSVAQTLVGKPVTYGIVGSFTWYWHVDAGPTAVAIASAIASSGDNTHRGFVVGSNGSTNSSHTVRSIAGTLSYSNFVGGQEISGFWATPAHQSTMGREVVRNPGTSNQWLLVPNGLPN